MRIRGRRKQYLGKRLMNLKLIPTKLPLENYGWVWNEEDRIYYMQKGCK